MCGVCFAYVFDVMCGYRGLWLGKTNPHVAMEVRRHVMEGRVRLPGVDPAPDQVPDAHAPALPALVYGLRGVGLLKLSVGLLAGADFPFS